jgi:y4mF family transcriptional regulator
MNEPPIGTMEQLGQRLRARRKQLGHTQATVASYAGCSTRFISELERGKTTVEMGKVIAVIQTLGLDVIVTARGE